MRGLDTVLFMNTHFTLIDAISNHHHLWSMICSKCLSNVASRFLNIPRFNAIKLARGMSRLQLPAHLGVWWTVATRVCRHRTASLKTTHTSVVELIAVTRWGATKLESSIIPKKGGWRSTRKISWNMQCHSWWTKNWLCQKQCFWLLIRRSLISRWCAGY